MIAQPTPIPLTSRPCPRCGQPFRGTVAPTTAGVRLDCCADCLRHEARPVAHHRVPTRIRPQEDHR